MLDSISSIWLWPIGVDRVFKGVESVVDGCISDCMNGDLKVKGIGKIDDGEQFGWRPDRSRSRAVCVWLGKEGSTSRSSATNMTLAG
jgi:hypothetical protein